MSTADERLAIWRYATPEERQRVIDAPVERGADHGFAVPVNVLSHDAGPCCPWGAALHDTPFEHDIYANVDFPEPDDVAAVIIQRAIPDEEWTEERDRALWDEMLPLARRFMEAWDSGQLTPDELKAHLRRLNAENAAQSGQATVLVALGAWLALLAALALVSACAFAAQWATDLWTLGHIAGGW